VSDAAAAVVCYLGSGIIVVRAWCTGAVLVRDALPPPPVARCLPRRPPHVVPKLWFITHTHNGVTISIIIANSNTQYNTPGDPFNVRHSLFQKLLGTVFENIF